METSVKNNRLIAEFMGYEIIQYKGQPTYNGNKYAKTIGNLKKLWNGLDLEYTGRLVKYITPTFGFQRINWEHITSDDKQSF